MVDLVCMSLFPKGISDLRSKRQSFHAIHIQVWSMRVQTEFLSFLGELFDVTVWLLGESSTTWSFDVVTLSLTGCRTLVTNAIYVKVMFRWCSASQFTLQYSSQYTFFVYTVYSLGQDHVLQNLHLPTARSTWWSSDDSTSPATVHASCWLYVYSSQFIVTAIWVPQTK